jgi:ATP-dependent exoDNAse (exonuclease V) alpha subunit
VFRLKGMAWVKVRIFFQALRGQNKITKEEKEDFVQSLFKSLINGWGEDPQVEIVDKFGISYDAFLDMDERKALEFDHRFLSIFKK